MTHIFVNVATADLAAATRFYTAIGATVNPHFTDEKVACLVWDDNIQMMVLTREFFDTFTDRELVDPRKAVQTLISISRPSRDEVDATIVAGERAGGREYGEVDDYGWMYSRNLEDPDGNLLSFLWMDEAVAQNGPAAMGEEPAATSAAS